MVSTFKQRGFRLSRLASFVCSAFVATACSSPKTSTDDSSSSAGTGSGKSLAVRVTLLLDKQCGSCHGGDNAQGDVRNISELGELISQGLVVAGSPKSSKVFQVVKAGTMPPSGALSDGDVGLIEKWIATGAAEGASTEKREFVREADVMRMCAEDLLGNYEQGERKNVRYFSLVHIYNAGTARATIEQASQGVSKLMNSLTMNKKIVQPKAINSDKTLFRIELSDYGWDAAKWDLLTKSYPYLIVPKDETALGVMQTDTAAAVPVLRGDWFLANGARAPLYYNLLGVPSSVKELQSKLGLDLISDMSSRDVIRAGFDNSTVSKMHRVIERHDAPNGVLWRSYEFGTKDGLQDIFLNPLGPGVATQKNQDDDPFGGIFGLAGEGPFGSDRAFTSDGGEFIYSLPNGMLGFFVADKKSQRLSAAPTDPGDDPIIAGMSCMGCHSRGFIEKNDQVRERAGADVKSIVDEIYVPAAAFNKQIKADSGPYLKALGEAGVDTKSKDPVFRFASSYPLRLTVVQAAAELGVTTDTLREALDDELSDMEQYFEDDSIDREQFKTQFAAMIEKLH